MNRLAAIFILMAASCAAFSTPAQAQQPGAKPAAAAEPLGEGESLPFMHDEKAAAPEEPSSAGLLFKTFGSLAFIVGLVFVGAWGAKKLGYGNAKSDDPDAARLSVLTSVSLGNGRTVSAIRFGERTLLVGSTPQSFTLLAEDEPVPDTAASAPRSVAELLAEGSSSFGSELSHAESRLNIFTPGSKAS